MSHARSESIRWFVLATALSTLGGSPPEVVRVRVPSAKVSNWFPPGSNIQILPYDHFERLAQAALARPVVPAGPRLLKARHSARWESGLLIGQTELTVDATTPGLLILDPWSPAIRVEKPEAGRLRSTADGRLGLKVGAGLPRVVAFDWTLRARPGSGGKAFLLGLPATELSSLALDLPSGLIPEASAGPRLGPGMGRGPGRSAWTFESARGAIDLRLRIPDRDADRSQDARRWLEGATTIDLGPSPINWRAEWTLDGPPGALRALTIGLDPGLDVVDVTGPRVDSYRVEPMGAGSKVAIAFEGEASGPTPLVIRAIARVPAEGTWTVPSARPVDATWTGGRTIVRPDPARVVLSIEERAGRRVAPRPGETAGAADLIFEPNGGPGPVANLTFAPPPADARAEVRGLLRLGEETPRLEASLTWTVESGRLPSRVLELAPGWTVDGVVGTDGEAIPWHPSPSAGGKVTVHLAPSIADAGTGSFSATLTASANRAGVTGPLDLPRVRPAAAGVRVVDEAWVATSHPGLVVRPIQASGLAWLDPPEPVLDGIPTPWLATDVRGALAWRWLASEAGARIDRTLPNANPRGEVSLRAVIRSGRLTLDWTVDVEATRGNLDSVPIHVAGLGGGPIAWKSPGAGGLVVESVPIDEADRRPHGLPAAGKAWNLKLSGRSRERVRLEGRLDRPWDGRGSIPIISLPPEYRARGAIAVAVENSTRVRFESAGLTPTEPSQPVEDSSEEPDSPTASDVPGLRVAGAFGYRSPGGGLDVETTGPSAGPEGGLIREAWLTSQVAPGSGMRHRLNLGIAADSPRRLALRMPAGVAIDRLRLDGLPVTPIPRGEDLVVDLPPPSAAKPLCSLTIEYQTGDDPRLGPLSPARLLPAIALPCLGFAWEVDAPEGWEPGEPRGGLEATDPRPAASSSLRWTGLDWSGWLGRDRGAVIAEAEALADLNKSAGDIADGETTLGDWVLKLDAGRRPLVVDRLAVRSIGWGPATRIDTTPTKLDPLGPVRSILEPMGLVSVALGGVVLITAKEEVPASASDREAWASTLRTVASEGSDATDRLQAAARWRGESTPRAPTSGDSASTQGHRGFVRAWRFASTGWPRPGASVPLVDVRADRAWSWLVASAVLTAGLLLRSSPTWARAAGLAAIGLAGTVGLAWARTEAGSTSCGLVAGTLGVLAFWLGRSSRVGAGLREVAAPTPSVRGGLAIGSVLGLAVVVAATAAGLARGDADSERPILALLPFDGPADPSAKPDRAILLVEDVRRLESLARHEEPRAAGSCSLISATHQVALDAPGFAAVASEFEIEVEGPGPATWSLPIGHALELNAEVDAGPVPLAIDPDGRSAGVTLEGQGVHRLKFRRLAPLLTLAGGGEALRLPINRSASSRVAVARGERPGWVEIVGAPGEVRAEEGGIGGDLGPLDLLEIRWFPEDRRPDAGLRGPVEAVGLWDAKPEGDLIRMRLTHSDAEGASSIRIALVPGVSVRRHSIPNVVATRIEGTEARPEWVAFIDPPVPKEVPIEVDFWRPSDRGSTLRRWPRIEVATGGPYSALIGLRRPGDWSGRLDPGAEGEPVPDQGFVKSWGTLPDDGLTLAGATRFGRDAAPSVETRPVPSRRSIRARVIARPAPGRLNASIEATLTDLQGRSFDLDVVVPADLEVVRLSSEGLLDWRRIEGDRLRLRFDNAAISERTIRIDAYLPATPEPIMAEARAYRSVIPWPKWVDAEVLAGTIEVAGQARVQFEPGSGTMPNPSLVAPEIEVVRPSYRVEPAAGPSSLTWWAPLAKVNVAVESELAIDPTSMTWVAALTCEVSGGPAGSLNLNLPTEWAEGGSIEVEGLKHRLTSHRSGSKGETTQWSVVPESPIWGVARLILRSKRPIRTGREVSYPQVAPLGTAGRGSVSRYDVAIRNGSGRPMEVAGSSGLQPVDASRSRGVDDPSVPLSTRSIDHAYHVTGERWSLRLKVGGADDEGSTSRGDQRARVDSARLDCVVAPDGSIAGRARLDLAGRPGPFLPVRLAEGSSIPWAEVEGVIVHAFADAGGAWLIPLGDRRPRRVSFAWHRPGSADSIALPTFPDPPESASLAIDLPSGAIAGESLEPVGRVGWEVDQVEQAATRMVDRLATLDRSSSRDREAILDDLIEIELRVRRIRRPSAGRDATAEPTPARVQSSLDAIAEASEAAGLDDLIQEARARVGVAAAVEESSERPAHPSPEVIRLRRSGGLHYARLRFDGSNRTPTIRATMLAPEPHRFSARSWWIVGAGLVFWLAVALTLAGRSGWTSRVAWGGVLLGVGTLLVLEPVGFAVAVVLFAWGRRSG